MSQQLEVSTETLREEAPYCLIIRYPYSSFRLRMACRCGKVCFWGNDRKKNGASFWCSIIMPICTWWQTYMWCDGWYIASDKLVSAIILNINSIVYVLPSCFGLYTLKQSFESEGDHCVWLPFVLIPGCFVTSVKCSPKINDC